MYVLADIGDNAFHVRFRHQVPGDAAPQDVSTRDQPVSYTPTSSLSEALPEDGRDVNVIAEEDPSPDPSIKPKQPVRHGPSLFLTFLQLLRVPSTPSLCYIRTHTCDFHTARHIFVLPHFCEIRPAHT